MPGSFPAVSSELSICRPAHGEPLWCHRRASGLAPELGDAASAAAFWPEDARDATSGDVDRVPADGELCTARSNFHKIRAPQCHFAVKMGGWPVFKKGGHRGKKIESSHEPARQAYCMQARALAAI